MAVLTIIDEIPLFETIQEALLYGSENGLEGYHTHDFRGKTGYMGGATHPKKTTIATTQVIRQAVTPRPVRQTRPMEQVRPVEQAEQTQTTRRVVRPQPTPSVTRPSTSTGGGGGGGY